MCKTENKQLLDQKQELYSQLTEFIKLGTFKRRTPIVIGFINKALSNLTGFDLLFKDQNYMCCAGIVRFQLDVLLKIFAIFYIDEKSDELINLIYKGEPLAKYKCIYNKNGKLKKYPLTDSYLCEQFENTMNVNWVKEVYKRTSNFVHPSINAFSSTIMSFNDKDSSFKAYIEKDGRTPYIEEAHKKEMLDCMLRISEYIAKILEQVNNSSSFSKA